MLSDIEWFRKHPPGAWMLGYYDGYHDHPQRLPACRLVEYLKGYDAGYLERAEDARHV